MTSTPIEPQPPADETCWTLIHAAARGTYDARAEFVRRYQPVARECLAHRWRAKPLAREIDDHVQEVFVDCFRAHGALERAAPEKGSGFRGFLFGIIRNVALRAERARATGRERQATTDEDLEALLARGDRMSTVYDREWARVQVLEAVRVHAARAKAQGPEAEQRREILRLRFEEAQKPREIAEVLGVTAQWVSHQYEQARIEFRSALRAVVAFHHPDASAAWLDGEGRRILALLK